MSFFSKIATQFRRVFSRKVSIGAEGSSTKLRGAAAQENFEDGTPTTRVTIDASKLKAGGKYTFDNVSVTIEGNVPAFVDIRGHNGQLVVTGDIGKKAHLAMAEPEFQQHHSAQRTTRPLVGMIKGIPIYGAPYNYTEEWDTDAGAKPPFNRAAGIIVKGAIGKKAKLSASLGVRIKTGPR